MEMKKKSKRTTNPMFLAFAKDPPVVLVRREDIHAHLLLAARAVDEGQHQCPTTDNGDGGACDRHEHQRGRNYPGDGISRYSADSMMTGDKGSEGVFLEMEEDPQPLHLDDACNHFINYSCKT